jgi:UDP-N-acetyl-D-mannosaminuronate dehydrogenase
MTSIIRPGRVWRPNWMKMMWRQRRTVLMFMIVEGERRDEENESSQMKPRKTRIITVPIKLRKYKNLTLSFLIKNVIKKITTSFTIWMTKGKMNVEESSVLLLKEVSIIVLLERTEAGSELFDSINSFNVENLLFSAELRI